MAGTRTVRKTAAKKTAARKSRTAAKPRATKPRVSAASRRRAAAKTGGKRKAPTSFQAKLTPSATLAAIIGSAAISRPQAVKKVWEYIRKHGLQNPLNRKNIKADDKLGKLFGGKKEVSMFDLAGFISRNLKK